VAQLNEMQKIDAESFRTMYNSYLLRR